MTGRQRLILLSAILGSAVVTIDSSVVTVALPAIAHDLGGGLSAQQWVSNAYLLTLSSLILVGASAQRAETTPNAAMPIANTRRSP